MSKALGSRLGVGDVDSSHAVDHVTRAHASLVRHPVGLQFQYESTLALLEVVGAF